MSFISFLDPHKNLLIQRLVFTIFKTPKKSNQKLEKAKN